MRKLHYCLLFFIVLLAGILRFNQIDIVPVSLYWDEAASTYNAYSILQTGKDEYGTAFPLLFRSFNDYKMPGNIYLTSFTISLFGLNEFSARFTSAFLGTLTVLFTFLLVKELLGLLQENKKKSEKFLHNSTSIGLLSAFLLAISPWHIQFSRTGFEANVGLFFVVMGAWSFLKGLQKPLYYFFSVFIFAISFYMYRSIHVFVPLLLSVSYWIYRQKLLSCLGWKKLVLGIVLLGIVTAPIISASFSDKGTIRLKQVNIFSNAQKEVYEASKNRQKAGDTLLSKIIYNRRLVYGELFLRNYILHFSPKFLFIEGDGNKRHSIRDMGILYLWEIPFIILGFYFLLFRVDKRIRNIVLAWILIAPIPASLSYPSPHALRSLNMLPMIQLVTAIGVIGVYNYMSRFKKMYILLLSCLIIGFFLRYLYLYYVITAPRASMEWADGYKQMMIYVNEHKKNYDKVVISGHYWQPYIYALFYDKYDPRLYQEAGSKQHFGKYFFGGTSWDMNGRELGRIDLVSYAGTRKALYALSHEEFALQSSKVKELTKIYNHNGELVFVMVEAR